MREINIEKVQNAIEKLCIEANYNLSKDVFNALYKAKEDETWTLAGDKLKITVVPKGFGSENMSQIKMLKPSDGIEGVKEFIIKVVKDAGPTTSYRMDAYSSRLLDLGLKAMIGKGARNEEVVNSIIKNKAIYLGAIGGAAALISKTIVASEIIVYKDLGAEAIRKNGS